ncbi:hypothetical protein SAMN06296273_1178 [Nitrosomonas ureae]|uniref:Uncharacterized protein n=1 Tax=Nitrosomonas ureae TaxID=44577 RepID=A0A285BY37_9PROT|nr:hypothetical protein SAMN06296273_1178 [Nitrosomonas ureae]
MNKDEVRRLFPSCVEFANHVRNVFGPGVKMTYAEEGGRSIGKKSECDPDVAVSLKDILQGNPLTGDGASEGDMEKDKPHAK